MVTAMSTDALADVPVAAFVAEPLDGAATPSRRARAFPCRQRCKLATPIRSC